MNPLTRTAKWLFHHDRLPWLVMLLIAGLGLGTWLTVNYRRQHRARQMAAPKVAVVKPVVPDHGPLPAEVAANFIHAGSQAERLLWVRHADQVGPLMAEFFSRGRGAQETVTSMAAMSPAVAGAAGTVARFAVTLANGPQRLLCVVREDGAAKVDFNAYARHGTVTWDDLLAGKAPQASELRVFIQKGDYYNYEFSHEARWQNFTATSPDHETSLQLYIARNHPAVKMLEKLPLRQPLRVTVALRALGGSHLKRQFEITNVLGSGWVLAD
jgi:hypothetical protein